MKQVIFSGLMILLLMSACKKSSDGNNEDDPGVIIPEVPFDQLRSSEQTLNVAAGVNHVNLMGDKRKDLPQFPSLKVKGGKAIGYVKDSYGRPVANASIGVRASVVAGIYTAATGNTNDKGYYELDLPQGTAHYYNAGYVIDLEGGRAALGLYPVDGQLTSFASAAGAVKNFVMLPYGLGEPGELAARPHDCNNYLGGSMMLMWVIREGQFPTAGSLPEGMVFEVKLTPLSLFHGDEKRTFIIRKTVRGSINLSINNLPIGKYRVEVRSVTAPQQVLFLKETGVHPRSQQYGLFPKTGGAGTASYTHITVPAFTGAGMPAPFRGHWDQPVIMLGMIE